MEQLFLNLIRMAHWLRHRPSRAFVIAAAVALAAAAAITLVEATIGWPEALRLERVPRLPAIHR